MPASYATHRKQLELILRAWGMPEETAASTAEIMSWADLHGIDTHGISMVPPYDERRRAGRIDMRAQPVVARETPVSALIDGGSGLGHANARRAMELAIDKAKATGIGVAAVRNSAHFGACGFYALMAVEAGLIGMVTTSASGIQVAPTFGAQPARADLQTAPRFHGTQTHSLEVGFYASAVDGGSAIGNSTNVRFSPPVPDSLHDPGFSHAAALWRWQSGSRAPAQG